MERIPKQGEFYRHFKNKLYQIVAIAEHSENGEVFVVYQALYGTYRTYVRPLPMFVSEVDREKYPHVTQKYRFERVEHLDDERNQGSEEEDGEGGGEWGKPISPQQEEPSPNPYLMAFLEAETIEKRLEILLSMRGKVGPEEVDSICLVTDIPQRDGDVEERLLDIRKHLEMRKRYDGSRLR